MKKSEAFRLTKKHLWDGRGRHVPEGKEEYVCYAAELAGPRVYGIVQPIIKRLLKGSLFLGEWLLKHHYIDAWLNQRKYQQTRHAWVDHLITHYESLGD